MTFERISSATTSTNLAWSDTSPRDVDYLTAMGAVAASGDSLGPQVARLLTGDPGAFKSVKETLWRKFMRKRILTGSDMVHIEQALTWWLRPACTDCVNGHRVIPDTVHLREEDCDTCKGTGKRKHPSTSETYGRTLAYLDAAASSCGHAVREKVA